jgi:hypothetical protein
MMPMEKNANKISDGINRRFFQAIDVLIAIGQLKSLNAFCIEFNLSPPRYREMRRTYGIAPNPNSKYSRYKAIEFAALCILCNDYNISVDWFLFGRGNMFANEKNRKV